MLSVDRESRPEYTTREFFAPFFPKNAGERLIAMLRAYFDDSGTHTGGGRGSSPVVVVGGIIATDDQHDKLKETWDSRLKPYNLPHFHMTKPMYRTKVE